MVLRVALRIPAVEHTNRAFVIASDLMNRLEVIE